MYVSQSFALLFTNNHTTSEERRSAPFPTLLKQGVPWRKFYGVEVAACKEGTGQKPPIRWLAAVQTALFVENGTWTGAIISH
jgi:hypothetical protein